MSSLGAMGGDLSGALENISVPSYAIDSAGVIRWVNPAAKRLVGDVRGRQFTSVVAPWETRRAREYFAKKVAGTERVTDGEIALVGADGANFKVDISSVPLQDGIRVVGVFGQVTEIEDEPAVPELPMLTPRQAEILHLLEHGKSTDQIASELNLSRETVRNHVRRLLRSLGVHSRLEAVAHARRHRPPAGGLAIRPG